MKNKILAIIIITKRIKVNITKTMAMHPAQGGAMINNIKATKRKT